MDRRAPGQPPETPCGDALVRLSDVPFRVRKQATERLISAGHVDPDEAFRLLELLLEPGDASARVALAADAGAA